MDVFFEQYKPASSIANYLTTGGKHKDTQTLGLELEHFVVVRESLSAVPYCVGAGSPAPSVEKVLERIKPHYCRSTYEEDSNGNRHLFALSREKVVITLEPGAQLEISIGPALSIQEIQELYTAFRNQIELILDEMGLQLLELGYHPTSQAKDIPLIPKQRYQYMNEYFSETGNHGICMMRATASTQISVDYESEADAITKFCIANALGPLFAFITDNAPVFEGNRVGSLGGQEPVAQSGLAIPKSMARMTCWDDTDPKRCLVTKGAFDDEFSFLKYAEVLTESPGIFLPAKEGSEHRAHYLGFTSFDQVLPNEFLDEQMILHILSLFFFDTRFKTYLELRQADSLPLEYALAYAALISGIFYNPQALRYYSERFLYTDATSVAFAKSALRSNGFAAVVYGRSAAEWLDEMIEFATEGLSANDAPYLAPLAKLVAERKTPLEVLH